MELVLSVLALVVSAISAFYALKVSRVQMLGRPAITNVDARDFGRGFLCLAVTFDPGDMTTTVRRIAVKGCRLARPRIEGSSIWMDQMHRWATPAPDEYADIVEINERLKPGDSPHIVYLACSPVPSTPFVIKCKTDSIFMPIKYRVTVVHS